MLIQYLILFIGFISQVKTLPGEGKWDINLTKEWNKKFLPKTLFKGSQVFIRLNCESPKSTNITISWVIVQPQCWDFSESSQRKMVDLLESTIVFNTTDHYVRMLEKTYACEDHIILEEELLKKNETSLAKTHPLYHVKADGLYVLGLRLSDADTTKNFSLGVHVEMKSDYGYLSAADYPLLPFYGFMCIFYVILGLIWLLLSFFQWRDLLRVQFWIGGVILLGMLEKATFYAEFQSINNTGVPVQGAVLFAEWVSCAKRTVARMLVIIVSLGFGIVKPRLGAALHRVVGVGLLYFFLASYESYLRVTCPKNEQQRDLLVASVPLAVLDSAICWWIFSALVNTTRTLRLRRNEVKLALYRHFTNTLIFAVFASVVFMLYSIKTHHLVSCLKQWKGLWIDEAYWHILFSAMLLVIMVLWRPTNNNQRYAFVPFLETGDEEEEEQLVNDAYGVKVRIHHKTGKQNNTVEDDLKWLEDNVTIETTLPVLDSDEELVNTRFEVSKMQ